MGNNRRFRHVLLGIVGILTGACAFSAGAGPLRAAAWQYRVAFDRGPDRQGNPQPPGDALLWLPPEAPALRGLLVAGQLGIEGELVTDPAIRAACADHGLGIVYFRPHLSGVFHYWEPGNRDGDRLLRALDDLARAAGRPEVARVPWIAAGHSTAGIFARNLAYWKPDRVAAVVHLKSGNFHQPEHRPPQAGLRGVPLLAINGQFETFGPEGGLRAEFGRETQWVFVLKDIQRFRAESEQHLMSLAVQPGADHFHGSPELASLVALFLRKTAERRLPEESPRGRDPAACLPIRAEDGWLACPDLYAPGHPAAPHAEYAGPRQLALWHYDGEMAAAVARFHDRLGDHQVLANPECAWLDEGDGWTFRARAEFLDAMPEQYGGNVGGRKVGHAPTPPVYRAKPGEPVEPIGADRFRLLRPARRVHVAAFHPGDERYRPTIRWGSIEMPKLQGAAGQKIDFPPVGDLRVGDGPVALRAKATSGLPVYYEVDYGPVEARDGRLSISELPAGARFPIECKVTAHQVGRRLAPAVEPAEPVSATFRVLGR